MSTLVALLRRNPRTAFIAILVAVILSVLVAGVYVWTRKQKKE